MKMQWASESLAPGGCVGEVVFSLIEGQLVL